MTTTVFQVLVEGSAVGGSLAREIVRRARPGPLAHVQRIETATRDGWMWADAPQGATARPGAWNLARASSVSVEAAPLEEAGIIERLMGAPELPAEAGQQAHQWSERGTPGRTGSRSGSPVDGARLVRPEPGAAVGSTPSEARPVARPVASAAGRRVRRGRPMEWAQVRTGGAGASQAFGAGAPGSRAAASPADRGTSQQQAPLFAKSTARGVTSSMEPSLEGADGPRRGPGAGTSSRRFRPLTSGLRAAAAPEEVEAAYALYGARSSAARALVRLSLGLAGEASAPGLVPTRLVRTADGRFAPVPAAWRGQPDLTLPVPGQPAEVAAALAGASPALRNAIRARPDLAWTLGKVGGPAALKGMPVWAVRGMGEPMIRGTGGDLVSALARAGSVDEVVRVIVERGDQIRQVSNSLPRPVLEVIQQIRQVSEAPEADGTSSAASPAPVGNISRYAWRAAGTRQSRSTSSGMTGLRAASSARVSEGVGGGNVSRLAQRLKELIHLAEGGLKGEAQKQVRMAEDSAAAKSEGQSAPSTPGQAGNEQVDVDALGREVLEAVSRELEMRRERRQEGGDDFSSRW